MKSNAFKRGFTLIELMIVIVILGILMGTILPRLSGAQSRARDTAKMADLTNIAQALEVYYNDFGSYPTSDTYCLSATDTAAKAISVYLKGEQVPRPGNTQARTLHCTGSYYYKPLFKGGVPNSAYVLAADLETFQMANWRLTSLGSGTFDSAASGQYEYLAAGKGASNSVYQNKFISEASNAQYSIFVLIP